MTWIVLLLHTITIQPHYYTNTNYYYQITGKDSIIYGATNGGMTAYDLFTGTFKVLTNSDGLWMNRQTSIALDSTGHVWAGSVRGLSQVSTGFDSIQTYPIDCLPCAIVTTLHCIQDTLFVGTQNGVLVINMNGTPDVFNDDVTLRIYESLGLSSANITSISTGNEIWIGTDWKLNRFSKDFGTNTIYGLENGLLDNHINCVTVTDSNIYVGTDFGLNMLAGDHFDTLLDSFMVKDIEPAGDSLLLVLDSSNQVGLFFQGSLWVINHDLPYRVKVKDIENINGKWYCGIGNRWLDDYFGDGIGMYNIDSAAWELVKNPGLASNHICDISANDSGVFAALGRRSSESKGFSWLTNSGDWKNYSKDSILPSNHIHRCVTSRDGNVWFGINSFPNNDTTVMMFSFNPTNQEWKFITNGYNGMEGANAIWDIEFDLRNNLYLSLAGPSDKLWVIDSSLNEVAFLGDRTPGFETKIAIDSSARVWSTLAGRDAGGVLMIDTRGTLFERGDDLGYTYGISDGFLSIYGLGCVVDKNNNVYIANQAGLVIYDGSSFIGLDNISEGDLFDVELDNNGRVWLLTRTGIYYYDPAFRVWDGWTFLDLGISIDFISPQEYIQIQGFEFDPLRKCFWLGGETGLLKLAVTFDETIPLDSIIIYPNPVVNANTLRIKNLPEDGRINIYSISGRCIAKDLVPDPVFGEIVWEIPAHTGSGLYFVLLRSSAGTTVRKFAIVR